MNGVIATALCDASAGATATCAVELPAGDPPEWIDLMPVGALSARDGRSWTNDRPRDVLAATRARAGSADLVIDYEHQTDHAAANGRSAPAAGWMRELALAGDMIRARVDWTPKAAAALKDREYRYISPVFHHEKGRGGRVRRILRAALTNTPALDLPALARDQGGNMPEWMKALLAELGLAEDADESAVKAALAKLKEDGSLKAIAKAVGLEETATLEEVAAKVKPAGGEFVPRAEFDRVAGELSDLRTSTAADKAAAAVDDAIAAGKIAPAQKDWATSYAKEDLDGFGKFVDAAPAIVTPGTTGQPSPGASLDPSAELTEEEVALCADLGVSEEAYKKSRVEVFRNERIARRDAARKRVQA